MQLLTAVWHVKLKPCPKMYLQYIENDYIKHWFDSNEIIFYRRYVDDILIIYNQNKIKEDKILEKINNIDKHLQFKMTTEENGY